jgi:hypothetical protein
MTRRRICRYLYLAFLPALFFAHDALDLQDSSATKDTLPKVLYKVEPEYTNQARGAGLSGAIGLWHRCCHS